MSNDNYLKLYIAVLDEFPDYMTPTLVAHGVLGADIMFTEEVGDDAKDRYLDWKRNSFKKVVLRVNQKEYDKIKNHFLCYEGHENNTIGGKKSCIIPLPVASNEIPNVLKFAKLWKPL